MTTTSTSSKRHHVAWRLLPLIPLGLFVVVLFPGLGVYGEGFWSEWLGADRLGSAEYPRFAATLRLWTGGLLVAAAVVAFAGWLLLEHNWRRRLLGFQVSKVTGFRSLVYRGLGLVLAISAVVAFVSLLLAPDLLDIPVLGWVVICGAVGVFGALMFASAILAGGSTNRLFFGR